MVSRTIGGAPPAAGGGHNWERTSDSLQVAVYLRNKWRSRCQALSLARDLYLPIHPPSRGWLFNSRSIAMTMTLPSSNDDLRGKGGPTDRTTRGKPSSSNPPKLGYCPMPHGTQLFLSPCVYPISTISIVTVTWHSIPHSGPLHWVLE